MSFDLLVFGDAGWGDELLAGALITLQLALCALALGLIGGLTVAGAGLAPFAPFRWAANGYNAIIRGTPEFLILLIVYFGSERLIGGALRAMGFDIAFEMPKFLAAVIGLALIFAAYASEVFRGAFHAVPPGQMEAARAVGMSGAQAFFRIRLPQMWRFALPGLGNLWMVLLKDTSLAAVIALDDLLRQAKVAGETTREPLVFYLAAGAIYLILTAASDVGRSRIDRAAQRGAGR